MIYPIRSIVAGIADPNGPDPLLAAAVALSARTGATLHLVHAFELPDPMWDAYVRMGYTDGNLLRRYTERLRARLEAQVRAVTPGERVHLHVLAGPPAPMIREVALQEEAELVVVGATRRGTLARTILGTTAQRVLRGATAPVLVLRGELPAHFRRVLLTTDLTDFSAGIHEMGLDVLEALSGGDAPELRSLLVVWYSMELPPPLDSHLLRQTTRAQLDGFLRERRARTAPVAGAVRVGDPAGEIVAEAMDWDADLVVVGTHGRSGPERWLLGSVAEATVRGTQVSVLVIPARVCEQRDPTARRDPAAELALPGR